jgi:hypothetical protein
VSRDGYASACTHQSRLAFALGNIRDARQRPKRDGGRRAVGQVAAEIMPVAAHRKRRGADRAAEVERRHELKPYVVVVFLISLGILEMISSARLPRRLHCHLPSMLFANQEDDALVAALRRVHETLNAGFGVSPEASASTRRLLECALQQKHDLEVGCSVVSKAIH